MPKKIINLISGPRNLSTALMYSFAQRPDTKVIDEPFYAHYLLKTGVDHPGRDKVIASMEHDPEKIKQAIFERDDCEVLFLKGMAHHLIEMDLSFLDQVTNLFLIRNPQQLIASFSQVIEQPVMRDIGIAHEWELFERIQQNTGQAPVVLDSGDLVQNPPAILSNMCDALGIPYDKKMLSWPQGGNEADGVWKTYWYQNVHNTTGFKPQTTSNRHLPSHCEALYKEALPIYKKLRKHAIKF